MLYRKTLVHVCTCMCLCVCLCMSVCVFRAYKQNKKRSAQKKITNATFIDTTDNIIIYIKYTYFLIG